ncbi:AimR family lysis-lysogeny pheromone receptor [Bacillus sp. SCS-151]|uniref:AimR family lysis-lysogeny pheromone receptor n=1 Tax=Nanhaiella sioensis TaxID=3115293 RepID=UPI00397DDEDE
MVQRLTFKQKVLHKIKSLGWGYKTKAAKIANFKEAGGLTRVLNDESREFEDFFGLIKLVQELFPGEEKEMMYEYSLSLEPTKRTARFMLEYFNINRMDKEKKELIDRLIKCNNDDSKEWARLYDINQQFLDSNLSYLEALKKYDKKGSKSTEADICKTIFKAYCYLYQQKYEVANDMIATISEKEFDDIREVFIKNIFYARFLLIKAEYCARNGSLHKSREMCKKIIMNTNEPILQTWAMLHMGNSYMLDNYSKGNEYLIKGYEMSKGLTENLRTNIKRSMTFLDNLWGKKPRYLDLNSTNSSDLHEIVRYHINNKRNEEAMELLKSEQVDDLTDNQRAFHYYLKGLITRDIGDFCESVKAFRKSGDMYYRKLPLIELEKLKIDIRIIDVLLVG